MSRTSNELDRFRGCLLGLAVGDAVGTTVEFAPRGSFLPLTDMTGGGPFQLEPGQWTDDTSMALCLATSLIEQRGFDPVDQMNRYCNWLEFGYLSSNGFCFDIGNTVSAALSRYRTLEPRWPETELFRTLPFGARTRERPSRPPLHAVLRIA